MIIVVVVVIVITVAQVIFDDVSTIINSAVSLHPQLGLCSSFLLVIRVV